MKIAANVDALLLCEIQLSQMLHEEPLPVDVLLFGVRGAILEHVQRQVIALVGLVKSEPKALRIGRPT